LVKPYKVNLVSPNIFGRRRESGEKIRGEGQGRGEKREGEGRGEREEGRERGEVEGKGETGEEGGDRGRRKRKGRVEGR
jgi:ribonuclease E